MPFRHDVDYGREGGYLVSPLFDMPGRRRPAPPHQSNNIHETTMNWHTISIPLIIVGFVAYSVCQKNIPTDFEPLVALASAYFIAFISCMTILIFSGGLRKEAMAFDGQRWLPVIVLGFSLIVIELGFLYAYRTGWKISTASVIAGSFTAVALALIGILWYREDITPVNIAGILLSTVGVALMNVK
jgi:drug/metabolite transporter (DMT)-like permease